MNLYVIILLMEFISKIYLLILGNGIEFEAVQDVLRQVLL